MSVGMLGIRRLRGHDQAKQNQARCQNIGRGFNAVGNNRRGTGFETYQKFRSRARSATENACERYVPGNLAGIIHFFFPVMSWWLPFASSAISFQSSRPPFTRSDTQPCCPTYGVLKKRGSPRNTPCADLPTLKLIDNSPL